MLEELRRYSSLGTVGYYWEVLGLFYDEPNTDWNKDSLEAHFSGRIIDGRDVFDGGLPLLIRSGVLELDIVGYYHPTHKFRQKLRTQEHCRGKILESLLDAMAVDDNTYTIFSAEYCTFDLVNNFVQIDRSAFGLQFANIRDLLLDLGFLSTHPDFPERSYVVNKPRKNLFDKYIRYGIGKRRVPPEQLQSIQAKQQQNGLEGESFVYAYEGIRTGRESEIEWIASYDTAAGFDIMSFETKSSPTHDRFIEVKTYSGSTPYFYWSRNEMQVARTRGGQYFLYLVNLDKIKELGYEPIIINNPAVGVLESEDWEKMGAGLVLSCLMVLYLAKV